MFWVSKVAQQTKVPGIYAETEFKPQNSELKRELNLKVVLISTLTYALALTNACTTDKIFKCVI